MYGYWRKLLEIDLSSQSWRTIELDDTVYRLFLGGRGLATYYLARNHGREWRKLDPLSPDNPLILATGPLTGYYPGIKMIVSGKSPQSRGVVGSGISSEVGVEIKACGYDAVVVKGASEKPVYIYIEDNRVDIRDAGELWGLTNRRLLEKMAELSRREHGLERQPSILYIGPAGENQVKTAVTMTKLTHATGYGGYGAVMGSKRLKAIVIKGNNPLPRVADSARFEELRYKSMILLRDRMARFRQWGTTAGTWYHGYHTSSMPIKNWREEWHDNREFSHEGFERRVWVKNPRADFGCPVACMKMSRCRGSRGEVYVTDGPDYEMAAYLGSNLGVFDPVATTMLAAIADELGLCGIQTGNVIGFLLELIERGVVTRDDVGYDVKWGDVDSISRLLHDIAYRRGFGNILAEGIHGAVKAIEKLKNIDVSKYTVQVKGIGIGAHGIRSGKDYTQLIAYAGSVQGGDHTSVAGLPVKSTESEAWSAILDSGVICLFLDLGEDIVLDFLNTVTGWGYDKDRLYDIGVRTLTLQRMLLLIGGPDVKWNPVVDDDNPSRFYEPLPSGPYRDQRVEKDKVREMLNQYYSELGWDERGIPREETLDRLGLTEFKSLLDLLREEGYIIA